MEFTEGSVALQEELVRRGSDGLQPVQVRLEIAEQRKMTTWASYHDPNFKLDPEHDREASVLRAEEKYFVMLKKSVEVCKKALADARKRL